MKKEQLVKNYLYNTIYQILILIAPFVTTPYISRVLGVTNIGIFQYSQSIATYFVLVGAVGTSLYGQREIAYLQEDVKRRSIAFWEIETFRMVASLICTIIYYLLFCVRGEYSSIYLILVIEVIATAFDISWFFMGMEDFKLIVIRNTFIKITGVVCVFIFVKKPSDLGIYTLCMTLPILLGNVSLWLSLKKYLVKTRFTRLLWTRGIIKRLPAIFMLFLPQVAQEVYLVLDKTMIGLLGTSVDQVGYYSQAQKIVKVVLSIATSLGTVMLPAMSASFSKGDHEGIVKSIKTAFRFIYMLSFALFFGLCAIASKFVPLFFGDGYEPVILLMIVISPILVIISTSNVIGKQYLLPTNQQKEYTFSIIAGAVVNFLINLVFIPLLDSIGASIATVLAEIAVTAVQCWCVKDQLPLRDCLLSGARYLGYGLIMYLAVKMVGSLFSESTIWAIGTMIIVGMVVYGSELVLFKDPVVAMGIAFYKKRSQSN